MYTYIFKLLLPSHVHIHIQVTITLACTHTSAKWAFPSFFIIEVPDEFFTCNTHATCPADPIRTLRWGAALCIGEERLIDASGRHLPPQRDSKRPLSSLQNGVYLRAGFRNSKSGNIIKYVTNLIEEYYRALSLLNFMIIVPCMSGTNWFLLTVDSKLYELKYIGYVVNMPSIWIVDLLKKKRIFF
jgi:hypothetical protein